MNGNPAVAKQAGKRIALREDWEQVKYACMREVLLSKFGSNPVLKEKLLALRGIELVEVNTWGDRIWGQVRNKLTGELEGENLLGYCLMEVIEHLCRD
jgi:ribA/ribD-fused uncharacterized protein